MTFEEVLKSMSFEDSMRKCNSPADSSVQWKAIAKAHDDVYLANIGKDLPAKIPKILHQIWLGGPMPEKYKILTDIWRANHPDWSFLLWDEKAVNEFGLTNRWMYEGMRNPSAKSDVIRYEVAYSYGGIYVDTDFLNLRSFNDLLHLDFFAGLVGSYDGRLITPTGAIAPSLFGCSQGNPLVAEIIKVIGEAKTIPYSIPEIMTITGPEMFGREVANRFEKYPNSVVFPPNYFHSFPGQLRESIRNLEYHDMVKALTPYVYPETYAMHLCYCSWQKRELL